MYLEFAIITKNIKIEHIVQQSLNTDYRNTLEQKCPGMVGYSLGV